MAPYASPPSSSAHGTPLIRRSDASGKDISESVLLHHFGDEVHCPVDFSSDAVSRRWWSFSSSRITFTQSTYIRKEINLHTENVQSAQTVLRELNRCQRNFASADALFAELLAIVKENIHTLAEQPGQTSGDDRPSSSCQTQLFHFQEQRTKIERLEAECAELRAKNKFLEDLNEALTVRIAALQNRTLELIPSTPSTPSMSGRSSASELTAHATIGDQYARSTDSTIRLSPTSASSTQFLTPDAIGQNFESFPDGLNLGTSETGLPSHAVFNGISPTSSVIGEGLRVVSPCSPTIFYNADPAMLETGDQIPLSQDIALSDSGANW